ncbi:hypothetical protein BASA81_001579 [Batrachochytrium salamandrivorans]|nr:hypothetical protein BASA81_001579 [Batrachochytrium salamandrivorans]
MFRKFVEFLDVREATDEEVAQYEAEHAPKSFPPPHGDDKDEEELSKVPLEGFKEEEDEFDAVSLSSPLHLGQQPVASPPMVVAERRPDDVPVLHHPSPTKGGSNRLLSALEATPFKTMANTKAVSFTMPSSPFKPLPSVPQAKTPSPEPVNLFETPAPPTPEPPVESPTTSFLLPPTIKISHPAPPSLSPAHSVLMLDDALAQQLEQENAHLNGDLDDLLIAWAQNKQHIPSPNFASPVPAEKENSREQLQAKFQLEQDKLDVERAAREAEWQTQRAALTKQVAELESQVQSLAHKVAMNEAQDLVVDYLKPSSLPATPSVSNEVLKHCVRLTRDLEEEVIVEPSGKLVAALSAKIVLLKQQVEDEKLVLKSLFLSWMERAERQDAFEILASAFGLTQEDRKRLDSKPSWKRATALGVSWPFSESVADFVRDETS